MAKRAELQKYCSPKRRNKKVVKQMTKHQITIIGTDPPCPRCGLLREIVTDLVKPLEASINIEVSPLVYTDQRAVAIADSLGLVPGTSEDVAKALGEVVDPTKIPKTKDVPAPAFLDELEGEMKQLVPMFRHVNLLDVWLEPFSRRAEEAGILMTPVLVIDGKVVHSGSVPEPSQIREWLSTAIEE